MSEKYQTADEKMQAIHDAEAASRKAESEAAVFRSRVKAGAAEADLNEREKARADTSAALDKARDTGTVADLSGVSRGLSDSAGNFAANIEVMKAGGIGVEASNTNAATGQPAQTAEEALTSSKDASDQTVGRGPRGRWYVKRGTERVSGPYATEDEAKAALAGDDQPDGEESVEQSDDE